MTDIYLYIYLAVVIVYAFVLSSVLRAIQEGGTGRGAYGRLDGRERGISVVVCISSETEEEIESCIGTIEESIERGEKGKKGVPAELVVVGDNLDNEREAIVRRLVGTRGYVRYIDRRSSRRGKKGAQREGIRNAKYDNIVCTDGDCVVGKEWIETIWREIPEGEYMLLLPVVMESAGGIVGDVAEMEFACLQAATAGTANRGFPTMANGAGMAFSRRTYERQRDTSEYASGDDMFLLEQAIETGAEVRYITDSRAAVHTKTPETVGQYLRQRSRWAGKAGGYRTWYIILLAVVVFIVNLLSVVMPLLIPLKLAIKIFMAKTSMDVALCVAGCRLTGRRVRKRAVALMAIVYPLYVVVVALWGIVTAKRGRW